MSFGRLIAIEHLRPHSTRAAPAGSLLVPYGATKSLLLCFASVTTKLALPLDALQTEAFVGINIAGRHEPALVLEDWALRVDPESAYNAFYGSPKPGDAFVTTNMTGFVGSLDHATAFVTTDGRLIDEPDWGKDQFIGFRRWSVGFQEAARWIDLLPAQDLAG